MIKITQQKRNELLHRDEILALKEGIKTPCMEETKTEIANILKKDAASIAIKRIKGRFGSREFIVDAYVYDNEEVMKKVEPRVKAKKNAAPAAESSETKTSEIKEAKSVEKSAQK